MKYTVCENCGAFLDFGEICDCKKDGAAASGKATTPEATPTSTLSIPQKTDSVKAALDLAMILRETKTPYKEIAETIKDIFPKFNRQLLTACANWQTYGVILHPDGIDAICEAYDVPRMKPKENRKLDRRITFRCTTANYERIEKNMVRTGANTVQEFIAAAVAAYNANVEANHGTDT